MSAYISVEETAKKWNLSQRRVQDLCRMGKVPEARRFGTNWMIPADALRPADGRSKASRKDGAAWPGTSRCPERVLFWT